MNINLKILLVLIGIAILPCSMFGQSDGNASQVQEKLFEYPEVPDTIKTLENRTNYIIQRFWDNYDFSAPIKDKALFETTFRDYVTFFKYAHKTIVISSIKEMMRKAESNKPNFITIVEIAEQALYAPGAEYWSDEAYLPFIECMLDNNMIKGSEKERYKNQYEKISRNMIGAKALDFEMKLVDGGKKKLSDIKGNMILLFFNDDECMDCSISRLRLSTDVKINKLIEDGEITIVSVYPGKYSDEWAESARAYADNWIIGANADIAEKYDLRISPCIYILDGNYMILDKNVSVEAVKQMVD